MPADVPGDGAPDPGPMAQALARTLDLLVPAFGDYAFLHVHSDSGLAARVVRHREPGLEPALNRLLQDVRRRMTAEGSPIARAFASGEAQLSDVGPGPPATPQSADVASVLGPRSYVAVPVGFQGRPVGVLTVARFETEAPFGPRDLALTQAVASQLAVALHLARGMERAEARAIDAEEAAERERTAADEAGERASRHLARVERDRDDALAELERHREQARTTGRRFEARLLDAVGEAVIATDLDGRIVYWSRSAERLYGWSRSEALGRDLGETAPAVTSRSQASAAMARMMAGESWSGELEVRRKDGTTFPASLTGIPIFDDDGEAVGLISVSTDLTARAALEERLLRSQRAQGVGRVAGGVAHELNRCLTGIAGHAELIRRELEEEDLLIEDLEEIEASSRTAAALAQQLLLVLPVAASEEPGAPVSPATPSPHPGRVVLLVEDDPAVRDPALETLREDGHEVLEAEDGRAALLLWEQHADRVDLVVTDVMLPRMSGRALVDRLRLFRPELPALFMSGYTSDAVALHGITEGREPFVGKTFSPEALSGKVRDLLAEVISD